MNFTVYKSSAGSGKTFTLVKEYLKLALTGTKTDYYRSILAITFTNKAATEMKERVISTLRSFADDRMSSSQQFMLSLIAKECNVPEGELKLKATIVLASILHNYSDFNVTTIDKFVHRIVRSFAFDLRIPMNFEVELDGQAIMADAVDVLLARAGTDDELTSLLVDFAESRADEEGNWNIQEDIRNFAKKLLEEDSDSYIKQLKGLTLEDFDQIKKNLRKSIEDFESRLSAIGKKGLELISRNGIEHSSFQGGANGIGKYFTYLAEVRSEKFEPSSTVRKTTEDGKWFAASCKPDQKSAIENISSELLELFREAETVINSGLRKYHLFKLLYARIYSMSLLNEIEKILADFRSSENRIHISEFNKRISEVVSREPAPYIYERIGEKFRHYLIDEFQDTSELQWQNLLPLIENALGNGCFNMLVGDGKQAIYRFRGGEVQQFASLPDVKGSATDQVIADRASSLKRNYNEKILGSNFRSKKEIVEFNNELFSYVASTLPEERQKIYEQHAQEFNPENKGGSIEINFSNVEDPEFRYEILNKVHEAINNAFEDGYEAGDIAILTRINRQGTEVAEFLHSKGISVSSSESLVLSGSEEVRFIVSTLSFLNAPFESTFKAEMVSFLYKEANAEEKIRKCAKLDEAGFLKLLKEDGLELEPADLKLKSTYEICEDLLRIFNIKAENPYILSFLDQVLQFNLKQNKNIPEFLQWWEEKKNKISIDSGGSNDAVKIMTIHKSKGLEFPVVICPFLNWKQENQKDVIWTESLNDEVEDLPVFLLPAQQGLNDTEYAHLYTEEEKASRLDDINLLYVALTRAADKLHIFTTLPNRWGNLSQHFIGFLEHKGVYKKELMHYEFGNRTKAVRHSAEQKEFFSISNYQKTDWDKVVEISRESLRLLDDEQQQKISFGNLMHEVLSQVKRASDIPRKLDGLRREGLITTETENELNGKISRLLSNQKLQKLFTEDAASRNEQEIILPDGNFIRPDRVLFLDGEVKVIDYKTGKKREKDVEQVKYYTEVLEKMGYKNVNGMLVYINEEEIIEV